MHTVTFYSFKGGTGRSMALVNIGVELVRAGLRVLLVDFDLEAPGLDTFNLPQPSKPSQGLVDFVLSYLETGESPDVSEFIYKSPIPAAAGQLWVMPAGTPGDDYDRRFKSIDWHDLYSNRDGFLLFEDMKAQWEKQYEPDYVLIDSRTGHSDVSGICTRQLPDVNVLFFFPNDQNRRGLATVVKQIRTESQTARKKDIKLHFVMSNTPELDDEDRILAGSLNKLKETLGFDHLAGIIHHYQSLALVNQSVFTLDRPRTRLAQEYRELARVIRKDNLADREVALEFFDEVAPYSRMRRIHAGEFEPRIEKLQEEYSDDAEVLTRLAALVRRQRRFDEALSFLEQAAELGADSAEFHLLKAELHLIKKDQQAALRHIDLLLNSSDATYLEISAAANLLLQRQPDSLHKILTAPAFTRLDDEGQYFLANELLGSRSGLSVAESILTELIPRMDPANTFRRSASSTLVLALLGQRKYEAAMDVILDSRSPEVLSLEESFNYAMADWGLRAKVDPTLFQRVIELDDKRPDANGPQCLAIALWAVGDSENALSRLGEAWQRIVTISRPEFSCWSYLRLPNDLFVHDLKEIQMLLEGQAILPRFMREQDEAPNVAI